VTLIVLNGDETKTERLEFIKDAPIFPAQKQSKGSIVPCSTANAFISSSMAYDSAHSDGMPALVDNPNPSMTFTFFTDMTPITFSSTEPANLEVMPEISTISSTPISPFFPEDILASPPEMGRASHGKKRDASYIPRPPNAFILFRSSFIKSQQVPGKVEGNHSTLSKIIGECITLY